MKARMLISTIATALLGVLVFMGSANAAQRVCDDGTRPPCDGGGDGGGMEPPDYGDLIILYRDEDGVPIPSPAMPVPDPETGELVDGGLCWQPIAFPSDLCPAECVVASEPAGADVVDVNQFNCAVATGCANCTQEVDFGRINSARSPDEVFDRQLEDVVVALATADCISLDPAGRLVASRVADEAVSTKTIDSPLQNLAIYRQLMLTGFLGDATNPIVLPADTLDTAARGLGVASDKTGEVNVDLVAYLNQIMGLTATPTILDPKICETYREEVMGQIQLVEKCFLDYVAYAYNRTSNFAGDEKFLPYPAYIPEGGPVEGWFEYLAVSAVPNPDLDSTLPLFEIMYGPILDTVFGGDLGFPDGNIGGFAQAADDARAVIDYMHNWPVPGDFPTLVPCVADPDLIAYDLSISEESGLQVPVTYINGTDREFIVTVANSSASTDPASGTIRVIAVTTTGAPIPGSPWINDFFDLAPGNSVAFVEPLLFDLGNSTTVTWTATVEAEHDVNPLNNEVTATTSVRNTGGGGGGGNGNRP